MKEQTESTLPAILDAVESAVKGHVDPDDESSERSRRFQAQMLELKGKIDQTVTLKVTNGVGQESTPKKTTAWVTIQGNATVTAPASGSWTLMAKDTVAGKTIFSQKGVLAKQPIPFHYKTGFHAQLEFSAHWSEKADTQLKLHVQAKY